MIHNPFLKIIEISSYEMLGVVLYLIASTIFIIWSIKKKVNFNKMLLSSLIIGIIGSIGIHFLNMEGGNKENEVEIWLNLFPEIFFFIILLLTPVLLIFKITYLILNIKSNSKFNLKVFKSFAINFLGIILIFVIVLPLLNFIKFSVYSDSKKDTFFSLFN